MNGRETWVEGVSSGIGPQSPRPARNPSTRPAGQTARYRRKMRRGQGQDDCDWIVDRRGRLVG